VGGKADHKNTTAAGGSRSGQAWRSRACSLATGGEDRWRGRIIRPSVYMISIIIVVKNLAWLKNSLSGH
jgi:hypothetical protein